MSEIQIKNTLDKKLKKDYQILVPYSLIDKRIDAEVLQIQKNYKMKGFRPGKVPTNLIKQKYEASIMADESQKIINEVSKKIVTENNLKLAISPKIDIEVFEPKKDFQYKVSIELFPEVPEIEVSKLKLTKKESEATDKDIEEAITRITANYKEWEQKDNSYKAKKGDSVNIDYLGRIDDVEFEGGAAKNYRLELGSKSFIDDFEEQLIGKKAGDEVKVKVKFPKEYHRAEFAGKKAVFDVKINAVLVAKELEINDNFVKEKFAIETLEKFKEEIKKEIEANYQAISRNLFKKDLFELLNKKFDFDLPQGLIDEQANKLWEEVERELKANPDKFKNDKEKQKAKEEQRKTAEKMVRSGIILSQISQKNSLSVTDADIIANINERARSFPGQEELVAKYYQNNPQAVQEIRGVLLEEKVVDFILKNAAVEVKKMAIKDLEKEFK